MNEDEELSPEEALLREVAIDAYRNSETPEEAMAIVALAAGGTPEDALINMVNGATVHALRTGFARLLLFLLDEGETTLVLEVMNLVGTVDEDCRAGHPNDPDNEDEN